ncbi:MAG: tRNA preQ1(34) S-adenosylmethionine ribosyltransferase-isomerase QueA [Candidatus Komeilibacteria bacterium]
MKLQEFDYHLPVELIAQTPADKRDHSRLLVYSAGQIEHRNFFNLSDYLQAGDVLVLNDSKVFPARLLGRRQGTGGKVEIFLLQNKDHGQWECLVGHARAQVGLVVDFECGLHATLQAKLADSWLVQFNKEAEELMEIINKIGETPLPPYIKTMDGPQVRQRYQTVYAQPVGSVAAPTAGFHFTSELLNKLKKQNVQIEYVTLHVGLGTFAPVKTDRIEDHQMHSEYYEVADETWHSIQKAKKENRRIIAVGTTATRVLESVASSNKLSGWTDIFIYPGYKYKIVDSLITNFHLPKSTLLMLVSALLDNRGSVDGIVELKRIYQEAINNHYRFYSFGDAMLII